MTAKPADFHSDNPNDKNVGKSQSEADHALDALYKAVNSSRDAARPATPSDSAAITSTGAEMSAGDSAAFLSPKKPLNYYDGKLSAGAGTQAESGLKGLFNLDRLNSMLTSNNDSQKSISTRVDGLKKDSQSSPFVVPDFVPPFPSA